MRVRILLIIVVLTFTLLGNVTLAQISNSDVADIELVPDLPIPNSSMTATLNSNLADLNRAQISWVINGETIDSGIGLKSFTFKVGPAGSKTELSAVGITEDGNSINTKITLYPADVDLIYEAVSYTPPFYKGRAYFPYSGSAKVVAVPTFVDQGGQTIPVESLLFKWKDGSRNLEDSSGFGRNILYYKNSNLLPKSTELSVEVTSNDGRMIARNYLTLQPVPPKVTLYKNDPLQGILYNKALLGQMTLKESEVGVMAVPFFFGVNGNNFSNLKFDWNVNGDPVNTNANSITLRKPAGVGGSSVLYLQVSNTVDYFQFGNAQLSILFSATSN